jgi:hypothetical protein
MAAEIEQAVDDVPLGPVGRLMGLRVVPPELQSGEQLVWSARANRMHGLRAVGGRLFLTNRRLIFARTRAESLLRGKVWSAELGELASASKYGWRKMAVERADGETERFVVVGPEECATILDRAIRAAGA